MVRIELAVAALGLASAALAVPAKGKGKDTSTASTATATTKGGKGGKTTSTASSATPTATGTAGGSNLDLTVLQFALTLEHLEDVFYQGALQNFTLQDFENAGYSQDYYHNLKYIAYDEQTHVQVLEKLITAAGGTPNAACNYDFPYTNVKSFITLSSILENVGTSAYLGAAPLITEKPYLTVAGAILAVEALHTSMQRAAINEIPMANPFYTPLDGDSVYTLAAMLITSCPSSNMALPFTAFPTLQLNGKTCSDEEPSTGEYNGQYNGHYNHQYGQEKEKRWGPNGEGWPTTWQSGQLDCSPPSSGSTVSFTAEKNIPAGSYVTFVNGLSVVSVAASDINGKTASATIPAGLGGQSYAFITSSNVETTFDDSKVLFGPAVVEVKPAPQ